MLFQLGKMMCFRKIIIVLKNLEINHNFFYIGKKFFCIIKLHVKFVVKNF